MKPSGERHNTNRIQAIEDTEPSPLVKVAANLAVACHSLLSLVLLSSGGYLLSKCNPGSTDKPEVFVGFTVILASIYLLYDTCFSFTYIRRLIVFCHSRLSLFNIYVFCCQNRRVCSVIIAISHVLFALVIFVMEIVSFQCYQVKYLIMWHNWSGD